MESEKLAGMEDVWIAAPAKETGKKDAVTPANKDNMLRQLKTAAEACRGCALYKRRTNLVFGSGDPNARLMFIGEAPGEDEDLQGEPFVGRAGTLLTRMIEAINLKRQDVYIANILKCRPPNNRSPLPDEIAACRSFVLRQVDIIRPGVICLLGKFSSQVMTGSQQPIGALRGRFRDIRGIKAMPTFHPAYLLRNPNDKKLVWEDLKKVRDELKDKQ